MLEGPEPIESSDVKLDLGDSSNQSNAAVLKVDSTSTAASNVDQKRVQNYNNFFN